MHRVIEGLVWARKALEGPWPSAKRRPRGAKGQGVKYENALAKALPSAKHGQWFEFQDRNGKGWCQTDLLIELPDGVLVLESKYSWVPEGHTQLENLYRPVVERVWQKPMLGVQVCKNLAVGCRIETVMRLDDALAVAKQRRPVVLHWLGNVPLSATFAKRPLANSRDVCVA